MKRAIVLVALLLPITTSLSAQANQAALDPTPFVGSWKSTSSRAPGIPSFAIEMRDGKCLFLLEGGTAGRLEAVVYVGIPARDGRREINAIIAQNGERIFIVKPAPDSHLQLEMYTKFGTSDPRPPYYMTDTFERSKSPTTSW